MSDNSFVIEKGRTGQIKVLVTGVTDWIGMKAKFAAIKKGSLTAELVLVGDIDTVNDWVVFDYTHTDTVDMPIGTYNFEAILYIDNKSFIKNTVTGTLTVKNTVLEDPTLDNSSI